MPSLTFLLHCILRQMSLWQVLGDMMNNNEMIIYQGDDGQPNIEVRELNDKAVCQDFLHTVNDGKKYNTKHYNLDLIISLGYRVKSQIATKFRQ